MILRERLAKKHSSVFVKSLKLTSGEWHRVQVGRFDSKATAQTVARKLKKVFGIDAKLLISN